MNAKKKVRRPGRPSAAESQDRLAEIVRAARLRFGQHGYDGASLSAVASDTGVTLAALYHYVADKSDLYRLVFSETVGAYWEAIQDRIDAADPEPSFASQLAAFVEAVLQVVDVERNDFLAAVGVEVRRHPEFEDLRKERDRVRDPVFASLLQKSLDGGSLGDDDIAHQILMMRIVLMGWALEHVFNPDIRPQLDAALLDLAKALDRAKRAAPAAGDPGKGADAPLRPRHQRPK